MKSQSTLIFDGTAVLELLTHAKTASSHTSPYGLNPDSGAGLMLVKDDGIYLMSNGAPGLPGTDTAHKVVYARGYEALPATAKMEERITRYDKTREAVGGDDFTELLPAKNFERLRAYDTVEIKLTADRITLSIIGGSRNKP